MKDEDDEYTLLGDRCDWEEILSILFSGAEVSCTSIVQGLCISRVDLHMGIALTERLSVRGYMEFFEVVDSDTSTHYNATTISDQRKIEDNHIKAQLMKECNSAYVMNYADLYWEEDVLWVVFEYNRNAVDHTRAAS